MERVCKKIFRCAECKKEFEGRSSLHRHLKQHGLSLAEYYTLYYPRPNKLTGEPLPFKKYEDYFERDFSTKQQLRKWCNSAPTPEVGQYILSLMEKRQLKKERSYAPFHLETKSCFLPDIDIYKKIFGSYNKAAEKIGLRPLYFRKLPKGFFSEVLPKDLTIAIDTREQKPLSFDCNQETLKLEVGDYVAIGERYSYTYVDRKAGSDLHSTLGNANYERFKRELERVRQLDSYLFVVTESTPQQMIKAKRAFKRGSNIEFILKRVRDLSYEFEGHCQFLFTGSRAVSAEIIPRLLWAGKDVWDTDMQYFLDHELDRRNTA
tara:strand:- start:80 stop:1039 length:960 start_codon:yes stop_codon:yes gene_type:complete